MSASTPNLQEALKLFLAGRKDDAEKQYRQLVEHDAGNGDALHMLGVIATERKEYAVAIDLISRAIQVRGNAPEFHLNLGEANRRSGATDVAIGCYQRAIALRPSYPTAYNNLGEALRQSGRMDEAVTACQTAIKLKPDFGKAYNNLAVIYEEMRQHSRAEQSARRATQLLPEFPPAWNNLGVTLRSLGRVEESVVALRRALTLRPDYPAALLNLGSSLDENLQLDEALKCYERALEIQPDYPAALYNRSMHLFWLEDYQRAWRDYEFRFATGGRKHREFPEPRWDGSDLIGKTILIHAEQGLGDTIQFIRYAKILAAQGARVIAEVQAALKSLAKTVPGVHSVVSTDETPASFDVQLPMLSIPNLVGTRADSIPADIPYMFAEDDRVQQWKAKFDASDQRMRVGIVWAGNPDQVNDRNRSTSLENLAPLAQARDVQLYSLQKGAAAAQVNSKPASMPLVDWTGELTDFSETAALISNLDLVISVCTSVAHLAGAMGKPVWLALTYAADWRWLLNRADSPWYPTARLFRQSKRGEWGELMQRIRLELVAEVTRRRV